MRKYLIPLILAILLITLPSCAKEQYVHEAFPEVSLGDPKLETLTKLGNSHTLYFYHDTERRVGIWIAKSNRTPVTTPTIFVLPDASYMK